MFIGGIIVLPALLVLLFSGSEAEEATSAGTVVDTGLETPGDEGSGPDSEEVVVPVYRDALDTVDHVELEEYVAGVVSAEMPADFEMEALKAQALVARTFIAQQMEFGEGSDLPGDAIVSDTTDHQVYKSVEELEQAWGADVEGKKEKITKAVNATAGEIITYDDAPITASFFSTSNGYTENAEDYWEASVPYLRSVESPWDVDSPRYTNTISYPVGEVEERLGVEIPEGAALTTNKETTEGDRVETVTIGDTSFQGREVRESLDLDSSDFEWQREGNEIVIHTKGWGHGVGMSQYGADGMAQEGMNYREIVDHYYQDVEISEDHDHTEAFVHHQEEEEEKES
ncbi:stage II sporulation protein D [Salicibibacter kimchii]|uniref:Stage II sporulation protein D n=2 Tax=Salicibibacter kimchii TaxID=2099786 RepID=A0A345C423_9BACI|nr:stage II sporulation protein D [Salicibibacter kimchii]